METQIKSWLARDPDPDTRTELERLLDAADQAELGRRFSGRLEFGTAGLRGLLGAGPSRMNRLVVRETTAGLGAYLLANGRDAKSRGVVIGFDGRRGSRRFAEDTAAVLAALGIKSFLAERELPTPVCAYAVKELGAAAGIVITASHNPPEYNGYKVYWENGAQIIPPHDTGIAAAIERAAAQSIPWMDAAEGRAKGLISSLGERVVLRYLDGIRALSVHPASPARERLVIAYTPLHGVGARTAESALARTGFTQVHTVASQREPNGDFPTVRFPNPEEPGAMDAVLALAREQGAALACANDPDADRFAAAVRDARGEYVMLTGDEIGALLGADLLESRPERAVVATTIVSSGLLRVLAESAGAAYFETLTGFKWIANGAIEREKSGGRFIFGYEEALGYTIGGLVRDKDGISALVAFCELAAECAASGETLLDRLEAIYRRHGLFLTAQRSLALASGPSGGPSLGDRLRQKPPTAIGGLNVRERDDLGAGVRIDAAGKRTPLELPKSDVLTFHLDGGARVIVRPSGTEPKLKCYYQVRETARPGERFAETRQRARARLDALIAAHQKDVQSLG